MSSTLPIPLSGPAVFHAYNKFDRQIRNWVAGRCHPFSYDDEVVAEGVLRVFIVLKRTVEGGAVFDTLDALRNFLSSVTYNVSRALMRELMQHRRIFAPMGEEVLEVAAPTPLPDAIVAAREEVRPVCEAFASLKEHDRDLFEAWLEDTSYMELEARFHASAGALRVRMFHIRNKLCAGVAARRSPRRPR